MEPSQEWLHYHIGESRGFLKVSIVGDPFGGLGLEGPEENYDLGL